MLPRLPRAARPAALAAVLVALTTAHAQPVQTVLFPGVTGQPLLDAVEATYRPAATLGYDAARDVLFAWEQTYGGALTCVYTGFAVSLTPGADPSADAYSKGIDTEHTWPQSLGADASLPRSDMHHLFPTRSAVNSARGNLPFGEVPDALASMWYRLASTQTTVPATALDEWSERQGSSRFEPREDHKGNVARAIFYMRAVYPEMAATAAGGAFFAGQQATLLAWGAADPVDAHEMDRAAWIASQQGTLNPFVLDSTLARRAFGTPSGPGDPPPPTGGTDVFVNEIHYDNAGTDTGEFVEVALAPGIDPATVVLTLYNGSGGAPYGTFPLSSFTPGATTEGYRLYTYALPTDGLQNGSPDGLALSVGATVVQFLSYEGTFTAVGGPASGLTSTDIGVAETGSTPVGHSLQLVGTGSAYADFAWTAPSAASPGAVNAAQTFESTAPVATYVVTAPGTVVLAGGRTIVRWSGPGVPDRTDVVEVFLRKGDGAEVLVGTGPNTGKLKVTVPAGSASGSDYAFVVRRQADPAVFGASSAALVSNAAEQFVVSDPDAGEDWARTRAHAVTWSTPPTVPSGLLTVELRRANHAVVASYAGEPDDGTLSLPSFPGLAAGSFYVSITSEADPAFFGASPLFNLGRIEVEAPAEGASWGAGSTQTVTWVAGDANAAGAVRLALLQQDGAFSQMLVSSTPFSGGTWTGTVPAGAPAGTYRVRLVYTYTPPGGTETRFVVFSNAFAVTNPLAPPAPVARHFAAPTAGEASPVTHLAVRGLADGTEVGAFAALADGTPVLLASGVVEGGEAVLAVPSDVAEAMGGELSFGEGTALVLRAYADGAERPVEARSVVLGDGSTLPSVRIAEGGIVTVDASKGDAAQPVPTPESLSVSVTPNPARSVARVRFSLPSAQVVRVTVYDVLGREVATWFDGPVAAGTSELPVPLSSLEAGVYLVRVASGGAHTTQRLTVVR